MPASRGLNVMPERRIILFLFIHVWCNVCVLFSKPCVFFILFTCVLVSVLCARGSIVPPAVKKLWLKAWQSVAALGIVPVPSSSRPGRGRIAGTAAATRVAIPGGAVRWPAAAVRRPAAAAICFARGGMRPKSTRPCLVVGPLL